jgi:hypothetical protein
VLGVSWLERVQLRRVLNRYEAHQVVAAAFNNGAGRYLWDFVPGGLLVRHSGNCALPWPRGVTVIDRERDRAPAAGETLSLGGVVSASRRDARTGKLHALAESEFADWVSRQCERSGLRFVALRDLERERDQVVRPRDARSLTWNAFRFSGEFTVLDSSAWLEARSAGWGKARAFGFGLIRERGD